MALVDEYSSNQLGVSEATPADYFELLKPKVMRLVVFTALVGLLVAPGPINPFMAFVAILAIAVGAGASGALNMWFDSDIDGVMTRTAGRPIPSGRVTPKEALIFGLFLSALSVLTLGLLINWVAGGLLAFSYNDATLADRAYTDRLDIAVLAPDIELVFEEHGPHLPAKDMNSTVYVLRRT